MMDKKTLLENGLLEQYLLGELDDAQIKIIEDVLASDNDLKLHLDQLEQDFESLGMENAIAPPKHVKQQLLEHINASGDANSTIIPINSKTNTKFYLGIAASFAGLFLLSSVWMFYQWTTTKTELQTVQQNNTELNKKVDQLNKSLTTTTDLYATLSHPDTKQYIIEGNTLIPEGKVISYINHKTQSVVINTERLPKIDDDHDYQMWADVDGEMIDMGVISKTESLIAMNYINDSESLNITIEPLGGNDHPTVSRLIGNVYIEP